MTRDQFIITEFSSAGKLLKSSVWDATEPLGLGHPFRWSLEKTEKGFRVRNLQKLTVQEVSEDQALGSIIDGGLRLKINPVRQKEFSLPWTSHYLVTEAASEKDESELFKRSIIGTFLGLSAVILISFLMPKPQVKEEVLVPPQFAKIIMSPAVRTKAEKVRQAQAEEQKAVRSGSVVNAFKSQVVKRSTQSLLKGGALSILAKSSLMADHRVAAAGKSLFTGSKSSTLASLSSIEKGPQNTQVGVMGGKAGETSGVGYGQGEHGSVEGQGKSFVKLETGAAAVEEGLTKDEVGKVIHSHMGEIRYCYEAAMIRNANVQGKLVVDFVIRGKGKAVGTVGSTKVNNSTLSDPSLDQCILDRLAKWQFPNPKGGIDVAVSYPFIFKTLGK